MQIFFGEKNYKYFVGYIDNAHKIKPFSIILPKRNAYVKCYDDETKWMYFLIEDEELLKKYSDIWNKVSDSEPIYNNCFLKTKEKSYSGFHGKEMPKVGSNYICMAVI